MTFWARRSEGDDRGYSLSLYGTMLYFVGVVVLTLVAGLLLRTHTRHPSGIALLELGLCLTACVSGLSYLVAPQVFTRNYWHFSIRSIPWIMLVVLIQAATISIIRFPVPVSIYRAIGSVFVSPLLEEVTRAVMLRPLISESGKVMGILITAALQAFLHPDYMYVALGQLALCLLLLYTNWSIPATILAHSVMNAIAVHHCGIGG